MEREVSNVNQMEVKGTVASDGSIILPPGDNQFFFLSISLANCL